MEPEEDAGKKKNEEKPALKRSSRKRRAAKDESEEEDIPKKKRTLKKAAPKKATECTPATNGQDCLETCSPNSGGASKMCNLVSEASTSGCAPGLSGPKDDSRHHECQVFSRLGPEAEESEGQWRNCKKNPDHLDFLPAPDFINNCLTRVNDEKQRKKFRSFVDLTVKLRVGYTSLARPDSFTFSDIRGTNRPRVGTGFICHVSGPEQNKPCECHGRKQWGFEVFTALHVVYDSDEALKTVVDVFYDDKESQTDGRMKSVRGGIVVKSYPYIDICHMRCVTCDEDLGERIESSWRSYHDVEVARKALEELSLQQSCSKDYVPALIVSHPHGQPKHVTIGKLRKEGDDGNQLRQYTTPTCPGSSGAPVFLLDREKNCFVLETSVHSGSYSETCPERCDRLSPVKQLNYGHLNGYPQGAEQTKKENTSSEQTGFERNEQAQAQNTATGPTQAASFGFQNSGFLDDHGTPDSQNCLNVRMHPSDEKTLNSVLKTFLEKKRKERTGIHRNEQAQAQNTATGPTQAASFGSQNSGTMRHPADSNPRAVGFPDDHGTPDSQNCLNVRMHPSDEKTLNSVLKTFFEEKRKEGATVNLNLNLYVENAKYVAPNGNVNVTNEVCTCGSDNTESSDVD